MFGIGAESLFPPLKKKTLIGRAHSMFRYLKINCIFYFVDQNFGDSNSNFPFVDARNCF